MRKILLAEDDPDVCTFIQKGLSENGYSVDVTTDGRDALYCLLDNERCYDVAILDRMMPGLDGLSVLKTLRSAKNTTPVIFLTALGEVSDKVEGLQVGADDYMTKPFHISELHARVEVLARRERGVAETNSLNAGDLELDLLRRVAIRQGQAIPLNSKEFALLEVLMRNRGRIVTRSMLLERVWDFSFDPNSSIVETHISRLRSKIDKPFDAPLIQTIRNSGYLIE